MATIKLLLQNVSQYNTFNKVKKIYKVKFLKKIIVHSVLTSVNMDLVYPDDCSFSCQSFFFFPTNTECISTPVLALCDMENNKLFTICNS